MQTRSGSLELYKPIRILVSHKVTRGCASVVGSGRVFAMTVIAGRGSLPRTGLPLKVDEVRKKQMNKEDN